MARHDQLMKAKQVAAAASVINASPLPKKRRPRFFDDEISKRKSKSIAMNSGSTESLQKASSADQESSNSVSSDARGSHGIYSESNKSQSKLKARSSSPAYKSIEETTEASEKHIKALAPKTKMPVIPTGKRPPGKAKNTFNDLVLPDRSEYRSIEVEGKASPRKEFSLNSKGVSPNIPELSTSFLVTNSPKKANTHTVSPTKSTADNIQLASIAAPLEEPANVNVDPQLLEIISDEASLKSFVDRGWMNRMGITSPFEESEMMRLEYALEVF